MIKTRPRAVRSRIALLVTLGLFAQACGDDDTKNTAAPAPPQENGRPDGGGGKTQESLPDGGRATVDARVASQDAAQIIVDSGSADGGSIVFTRTDNCPADAPLPVDRVRIYTLNGGGAKLVGAKLQGSNEGTTSGFVDLATLDKAPTDGEFNELTFSNDTTYRYIRFFDPKATRADIAELEFYHGPVKLTGRAYGTAAAGEADQPFANAFDEDVATYFQGSTQGGNYLGYDVAGDYVAAQPTFAPPGGALKGAADVTLASATNGAVIRYTTDGSNPTPTTGQVYGAPIHFTEGRVSIRALATAPCYFESTVASANYGIGVAAIPVGQKSYHIGNSLTDQLNPWLEVIADSTGVDHTYARSTIPGSTIGWLWEHRTDASMVAATPPEATNFDSFVNAYASIDHMSLQPFADPDLKSQGDAAVKFFQAAQVKSPNVQPWIYAQWPSKFPTTPDGPDKTPGYLEDLFARGADYADWPAPTTPVPPTWEDTADAQRRYHEAFADYVDQRIPGKKVLVCPAGSALAALKRKVDAGQVPGMNSFLDTIMTDYLHLSEAGGYLVSLTFYACMYRQTPEGHVTVKPADLTQQQAILFQQIAWQSASGYARSGITQ